MLPNGSSVTKWFQRHLAWNFFDCMITSVVCFAAWHRKFIQLTFENLTCIAGNCFDLLWVRQLTLIGTSHGIHCFMHGTDGLINNWKPWFQNVVNEYWKFANYITTPLKGGEGKNVTVHFNVCKREPKRLKMYFKEGGWQTYERYVPSTCYSFLSPPFQKKGKMSFKGRGGSKNLRNTSASTCYFFPPPQFSKILLKWEKAKKNILYCYIFTSPPQKSGKLRGRWCKLRWFTWWQTLGKTHLAWNPGGGGPGRSFFQWQFHFKRLALASLGHLAWHRPQHRSLGSSTTPTSFCPGMMVFFTLSCMVWTYNVFAFHFLCPKWAAAWHTRTKSSQGFAMYVYVLWLLGTNFTNTN